MVSWYATLRSAERDGKASRLDQVTSWLGEGFNGVIAFDESHAMANAAGEKSDRGDRKASQQGLAGLALQNAVPDARVLYVSATGATAFRKALAAPRCSRGMELKRTGSATCTAACQQRHGQRQTMIHEP